MRAFALSAVLVVGCAAQRPIERVNVLGGDFKMVRTLDQGNQLAAFSHHWKRKSEATAPATLQWEYKLDIVREREEHRRWLYDATGWTTPLAVKGGPVFELPDPSEFNAVLGIPNKRLQPDAATRRR